MITYDDDGRVDEENHHIQKLPLFVIVLIFSDALFGEIGKSMQMSVGPRSACLRFPKMN